MFDEEHFPALQQEQPQSAFDFFQNSQDSIYNRVVHWIKRKKPQNLIIEGLELLKAPDWAYLLKQAIKRNLSEVMKAILSKSSKIIKENEASKILIMETAQFFQDCFDQQVIKLLSQQDIALKEEIYFENQKTYSWDKMKNDGSLIAYDEIGYTIAHYAAARGEQKFFEWLVEAENVAIFEKTMKIKSKNKEQTPLHLAVQNGAHNIIQWAISISNGHQWIKEEIKSSKNIKGENAFFISAKSREDIKIFKQIFEFCYSWDNYSGNKNKKGFDINEIIFYKAWYEKINYLQERIKSSRNRQGQQGEPYTSEHYFLSLKNGNCSFLQKISPSFQSYQIPVQNSLLNQKYGNFLEKCNIINVASQQDNLELLKEFFGKFSKDFKTSKIGLLNYLIDDSSLHQAAKMGHYHIVEQLISNKLHLECRSEKEKKVPLDFAKENGHKDIEYLLQHSIACSNLLENVENDITTNEKTWKKMKKIPQFLERISEQGTILGCAVKTQNHQFVKTILEKKLNINLQDRNGKTALFYSLEPHDIKIFKLLMSKGASLFIMDHSNMTPIHLIIKNGQFNLLWNIFEEYGPYEGMVPGINPILLALKNKEFDLAFFLFKYLPRTLKSQKEILFEAAEKNFLSIIEQLTKNEIKGKKLDIQNLHFQTPLFIALAKGNEKVADILLDNGASISLTNSKKQTALGFAIQTNSSIKIIEKMLQLEEKYKFTTPDRSTRLTYSIRDNNQKLFDLLLKYNTSINLAENLEPGNPVYEALIATNEQFLFSLLKKEPNICKMHSLEKRNLLSLLSASSKHVQRKLKILESYLTLDWFRDEFDIDGQPPLFYAVKFNNIKMVRCLFENGAKASHATKFIDENLLTQAIINENFEIAELLLTQKFDVNDQNVKGETALIKAVMQNKVKAAKFLFEKSSEIDINKRSLLGETPILIAINQKNMEMIKLLLSQPQIDLNIPDRKNNYPLLSLPFDNFEFTLAILRMLSPHKNKINWFVSTNSENILLMAVKKAKEILNEQEKKLMKKIIKFIMKIGFDKKINSDGLNQKNKEDQSSFDIAFNKRGLLRIAKMLMYSGCNGKKIMSSGRNRLIVIIAGMKKGMNGLQYLQRKEKRHEIFEEIFEMFLH